MDTESPMKKGLLIAAGEAVSTALLKDQAASSQWIVAADGGYTHCQRAGVVPNQTVGDFDSLKELPEDSRVGVTRLPVEKDDSDTLYAARELLLQGCTHVTLLAALGGRLDHTIANLSVLAFLERRGVRGQILTEESATALLLPGTHTLTREAGYDTFSLFPFEGLCQGVTIAGAKYPLLEYTLTAEYPVGLSNRFLESSVTISHKTGLLLLIRTKVGELGD